MELEKRQRSEYLSKDPNSGKNVTLTQIETGAKSSSTRDLPPPRPRPPATASEEKDPELSSDDLPDL